MGATYVRQSTYEDGDTITAAHTNDEFDQLLASFQASSGHTHDGTANEGGPITKLLGADLVFGSSTASSNIVIDFETSGNDGELKWMQSVDYFEFSDDILIATAEKLQFRDTAIYINSSTDGQLDLVADGAVLIDTAGDIILDADGGDIFFKDAGVTFGSATNSSGNLIIKSGTTTALTFSGANATFAGNVTIGSAEISEAELEILDGATVTTAELNALDGITAVVGELNALDIGSTAIGTAIASKAVILDADKDYTGIRNLTATTFVGGLTGNASGSAATLATARTIGGTSFDGSANIAVGLAATATALATARTIGGTSFDGTANIAVALAADATTLETARTIGGVSFDGSANIDLPGVNAAGNQATSGLAGTATALATARNIGGTSFDGTANIAVALASVGTAVTVADESSDTTCFPLFTTAATGDLPPKSGTNLTFNSSSGLLTATLLAGDLTGDVTGDVTGNADTATLATTVTVSDNESTNENNVILFGAGAAGSGAIGVEADGTMTYNPSTGKITATGFVGALTGNVAGNLTGTVATATQNSITTATGLVTTGALNAGSITSGFGAINNGSDTITTTGAVNFGAATVDSLDASDGNITNVGSIALDSISADNTALAIVFNHGVAPATHIDTSAGGSTAPNFSEYTNFVWTLTSNLVLTDPGDEVAGQSGVFVLIQDSGGSNTISTAAAQYFVPGATELVLSTTGAAVDVIPYMIQADGKILLGAVQLAFGDV